MTMVEDMKKADALKWLKQSKLSDIALDIDREEWLWELYPELKAEVERYKELKDIRDKADAEMFIMKNRWDWNVRPWNPL